MNRRTKQGRFLRAAGGVACIVTLLAMLGGHWLVLQSFAWARMIVIYSRQGSLQSALSKTFDGKHPCGLCVSIHEGRQKEQQQETQKLPWVKSDKMPELFCNGRRMDAPLPPAAATAAVACVPCWHADFIDSPPTPPPRAA
jgi:hypothetical protein